jgi:hypothetical protein
VRRYQEERAGSSVASHRVVICGPAPNRPNKHTHTHTHTHTPTHTHPHTRAHARARTRTHALRAQCLHPATRTRGEPRPRGGCSLTVPRSTRVAVLVDGGGLHQERVRVRWVVARPIVVPHLREILRAAVVAARRLGRRHVVGAAHGRAVVERVAAGTLRHGQRRRQEAPVPAPTSQNAGKSQSRTC